MRKKTSLKDRRLMLTKNSILMLVALVVVFLAIWAWYFTSRTATASNLTVSSVDATDIVEIALPNDDGSYPKEDSAYTSQLQFQNYEDFIKPLEKDVTSDGINFIIPTFEQSGGVKTVLEQGQWTRATADVDYISIDFYARSKTNTIFLKSDSYLKANSDYLTAGSSNTAAGEIERKSSYGEFSKDGIVGAMRVSLVCDGYSMTTEPNSFKEIDSKCKLLWVPRPDLSLDARGSIGSWILNKGVLNGDSYKHQYFEANSNKDGSGGTGVTLKPYDDAVCSKISDEDEGFPDYTPTLGQYYPVAGESDSEKITVGSDEYYLYKYTLNIWVEGTDTEARRAMNGGQFSLYLDFGSKDHST